MQVSTTTMHGKRPVYRPRNVGAFQEMLGEYRTCFSWDEAVSMYETYVSRGNAADDALAALKLVSAERGWCRPVSLDD